MISISSCTFCHLILEFKVTKKHEPMQEIKTNSDLKEKLTRATSPIKMESGDDDGALSTPQLIDAATSYSRRLDHSMEEEEVEEALLNTPTRKMDAATSYSCRSPWCVSIMFIFSKQYVILILIVICHLIGKLNEIDIRNVSI